MTQLLLRAPSFWRLTLLALLCLSGAMAQGATTAYTDGDLFLGVRATGGTGSTKDYLVNLGQANQFESATGSMAVGGDLSADLAATFGANWFSRTDLLYAIIGGTSLGTSTDPENTVFSSKQTATPWTRRTDSAQSSTTSRTASLGDFYSANASATNPLGLVQDVSSTNSYASYQPGGPFANSQGISFGAFNPSNEGGIQDTLFLDRLTPTSQAAGKILLGSFSISSAGALTFSPTTGPTAAFAASAFTVDEAVSGGQATVTLTRGGDLAQAFSVQLNTTSGTATSPADFTAQTNVTVNFASNQTSAAVFIPVANRAGFQGDRTFNVVLSNPTNSAATVTPSTATVTILEADPEPAGAIAFATGASSANYLDNGGSAATINVAVTRTGGTAGAVSAMVTASSTTLQSGSDFTVFSPVTFAAGVTTAMVSLQLGEIDPSKLPATVTLTLSAPAGGATLGTQSTTTITLTANGAFSFSASSATVTEAGSDVPVTVTVNRIGGASGAVSVQVVATGTATAGTDYTLPANPVVLSWANGDAAAKTFTLLIKADSETEADETVILALQSPTGGAVIGTTVTDTITIGTPDLVVPTLSVVSPVNNAKLSGSNVIVKGTAKDNAGVSRVEVRLNGTLVDTQTPATIGITYAYTSTIVPEQGSNTIEVKAFDAQGNMSTAVTRKVTFANLRPFLGGKYNGLLVADAAAAQLDYNGLVGITVTKTGTFTGKVKLSGVTLPIKGIFLNSGVAGFGTAKAATFDLVKKVSKVITPLGKLALTLDVGAGHQITGTIKDAAGTQTLATIPRADQALFTSKSAPVAPFQNVPVSVYDSTKEKGKYTALFMADAAPNNGIPASGFPQGDGFAQMSVTKTGVVTIKGKLADGSVISYSNTLSLDLKLPVFVSLYGQKGLITGLVAFDATLAQSDASSPDMRWFKPAGLPKQTSYPDGWPAGITVDFVASKFLVNTNTVLGPTLPPASDSGTPNITVDLSEGGAGTGFSNTASINTTSRVKILGVTAGQTGATGLKVNFVEATGLLSGSFTHPVSKEPIALSGVAYQKTSSASGYFLFKPADSTAVSGLVTIAPLP